MKLFYFLFLLFYLPFITKAGKVDTVNIYSNAMQKQIKCAVILPDVYQQKKNKFSVVYLLHGYSGDYSNWVKKVGAIKQYVDEFNLIIVCPDGGYSSWYFDSPIDSSFKYETYIANEVVGYIDKNYRTIKSKNNRAITGLSMGGHGALFLAFKHQDIFGAAGTMSGGVDLKESKNKFDIAKRIGDTINNAKNWHDLTVINLIENFTSTKLKLIIDCGLNDIFIKGNQHLHQKLLALNIAHDYIERPGEHNWDYWANAIGYQLMFFNNYFKNQK